MMVYAVAVVSFPALNYHGPSSNLVEVVSFDSVHCWKRTIITKKRPNSGYIISAIFSFLCSCFTTVAFPQLTHQGDVLMRPFNRHNYDAFWSLSNE